VVIVDGSIILKRVYLVIDAHASLDLVQRGIRRSQDC
jgi:hypothetical protein